MVHRLLQVRAAAAIQVRFWEGFTQKPFMRNPLSYRNPGALVVPVGIGIGSLYDHRLNMLLLETSSSKNKNAIASKYSSKVMHKNPLQLA